MFSFYVFEGYICIYTYIVSLTLSINDIFRVSVYICIYIIYIVELHNIYIHTYCATFKILIYKLNNSTKIVTKYVSIFLWDVLLYIYIFIFIYLCNYICTCIYVMTQVCSPNHM